MQPLTREWLAKAEGDDATATREPRARTAPNDDAACFHAHQCAEKYLKAKLQEARIASGRTHDLMRLLDVIEHVEPPWSTLRPDPRALTTRIGDIRYPGFSATKPLARGVVAHCRQVRQFVRLALGLTP